MPVADLAAPVPHTTADVEVLVRRVLADLAVVEPLAVDEPTAAKLLGISGKTLGGLPPARTGRFHVGRVVRYHYATLKRFAAELAGGLIEAS